MSWSWAGGSRGWRRRERSRARFYRPACSKSIRGRDGDQHAQQRGDSRRHLLSCRLAQGTAVRGRAALLYAFCAEHGVPHTRCGKLIVAQDDSEIAALEALVQTRGGQRCRASWNWSTARSSRGASRRSARWPACSRPRPASSRRRRSSRRCAQGRGRGGDLPARRRDCVGARPRATGSGLRTERETILARISRERRRVVRRRGLAACSAANRSPFIPCRGEYAELAPARRSLVNFPVYPLPHAAGHSLGDAPDEDHRRGACSWARPSGIRSGKDDYEGERLPLEDYLEPAQQLLPGVTLADLRLAGSGIRPKLHPPAESFADFMIRRRPRRIRRSSTRPGSSRRG